MNEFKVDTDAYKYMAEFFKQFQLLKNRAVELENEVSKFRINANEIYNELENIATKIKRLIDNKDLKCN